MAQRKQSSFRSRFTRREAIRDPYDVILIVCEGKKTEPIYFEGMRKAYQLSSTNVKVVPSDEVGGNDPVSLVRYALDKLQTTQDLDHVYCVFDRNGHANYAKACTLARQSEFGNANRLHVITSWPCFELWVLLHYKFESAPFNAVGGKSSCARVCDRVKKFFPKYEKGYKGAFDELFPRTQTALSYGDRLKRHNSATRSTNPSTAMPLLVRKLQGLRP